MFDMFRAPQKMLLVMALLTASLGCGDKSNASLTADAIAATEIQTIYFFCSDRQDDFANERKAIGVLEVDHKLAICQVS